MSVFNSTILSSVAGEDNQLVGAAVGVAAILATAAYYTLSSRSEKHDFPKLRGIQLYHAWNFFRRRIDFLHSNYKRNSGKSFSFNVLHHKVIALAGEDARRVFFSHQHFSFGEGYKILMGSAPLIGNVDVPEGNDEGSVTPFTKWAIKVLSKDRLQDFIPVLLQDITERLDRWCEVGRTDPFTEVYGLVFITTARLISCRDLTENEADLKKIGDLFMTLETSATPASLLLPWLPSPGRKATKQATTEMFTILYTYVETRRHAVPTSDTIDVLIADGESTQNIVGFVMAVLFAGIFSTSVVVCWMLIHLAVHPEWRGKCKKEIQDLISRHLGDSLPSATLVEKLAAIPISAWEEELPIIDACIRESQRISIVTVALRRNVGKDIKIGEQVVKRGDFLAYPLDDAHMNSGYYPDPHKYDPNRWLQPKRASGAANTFLGWGAGRHPCPGMKVAKLEMKLVMAALLVGYEFDVVDGNGKFPKVLPVPDRNDLHQARPIGGPYYFNTKKVA